jgi:polyphosphate kinase 2 (PPK2 family)
VTKHVARLEDVDLTARLSREEEEKRLHAAQLRLLHLRLIIGGQLSGGELGPPVCIVFEGWDAAGKGGAIKRLVEPPPSPPPPTTSCATISSGASGRRCPAGAA